MNILRFLIRRFLLHKNPNEFWKRAGASIGKNCEIHTKANLGSEPYLVSIGDYVRINEGVHIITHDGGVWVLRHLDNKYKNIDLFKNVSIGNNVHIGTNAIIMPGVHIGNNSIIGCGAIVTKNIPDNSIAVGIPARVIETINEYVNKHKNEFVDTKSMSYNEKRHFLLSKKFTDI